MDKDYLIQTITIGKDQQKFLNGYRQTHKFNLSKFVQVKLDEYIRQMERVGYDFVGGNNEKAVE